MSDAKRVDTQGYQASPETVRALGRVAVFMGGDSAERAVSLKSGNAVLAALQSAGVDAYGVDVQGCLLRTVDSPEFDRVFIALHGRGGEDGTLQAILSHDHTMDNGHSAFGVMSTSDLFQKIRKCTSFLETL